MPWAPASTRRRPKADLVKTRLRTGPVVGPIFGPIFVSGPISVPIFGPIFMGPIFGPFFMGPIAGPIYPVWSGLFIRCGLALARPLA